MSRTSSGVDLIDTDLLIKIAPKSVKLAIPYRDDVLQMFLSGPGEKNGSHRPGEHRAFVDKLQALSGRRLPIRSTIGSLL